MANLTLSMEENMKNNLKAFIWINWSEIAREETVKKLIFESYIKTGNISNDAWKFCERIDWHPVDELPLKGEFIKKMKEIKKEKSVKFKNIEELRKIIEK